MADPFIDLSQFAASSPPPASAAPLPHPHGRGIVDPTVTPPPQLHINTVAQDALVDGIKHALYRQGRTAVFTCGGRIPMVLDPDHRTDEGDLTPRTDALMQEQRILTMPVTLRWGDEMAGRRVELPILGDGGEDGGTSQAIIEQLARACTPATFGGDGEDVFDEEYRRAGALAVGEFMTDFCPYKAGIVDLVTQMLVPPIAEHHGPSPPQIEYGEIEDGLTWDQRREKKRMMFRGVRAELYKLNVYSGPSGHFKAHVDTPRNETQVGSLVVCLPIQFTGGALAVRHAGQEIIHDWALNLAEPAIQWAAFYSDCQHEVLQVTAGHRIILTYNLYLSPGTGRLCDRALSLQPQGLPIYELLKRILISRDFMPNGGYLGLYLVHGYPHTDPVQHKFVPNMLKGADLGVFEAVKVAGLIGVLVQCQNGSFLPALEELDTMYARHVRKQSRPQRCDVDPVRRDVTTVANLLTAAEIEAGSMEDEDGFGGGDDDMGDDDRREEFERILGEEGGGGEEYLQERHRDFIKEYYAEKEVVWVGGGGERQVSKVWVAYGNQAMLAVKYSYVSLIVKVPSWWERGM
ncbi:hypothetical protein LTR78_006418 [Recurvomyces mirabilis]|uniref:Fe2OG dioxygenase domain-containing protein n=1 Tax=Recurvomyces mirabilis TaxID=574656 RepID=A0AAE0WLC3_9PEZI|nr:hypothetical protein LTR78_006418 [Recurvomyces mirabilis]KAK5152305.1 hypothetical protein LTS14_008682 [Recurvomyces mirabilis]